MTSRLPDLMAAHPGGPVSLTDATIIAILRVIQRGWRAAADVAERDAVVLSRELPMTNRLRAGMRRVVDSAEDQCPMRITPGTEVIPSENGPAVGLTDISIYLGRLGKRRVAEGGVASVGGRIPTYPARFGQLAFHGTCPCGLTPIRN